MRSRISIAGHSLHKMLVPFPIGLLLGAVIFDIIYGISGDFSWTTVAGYLLLGGILGGLLAAPIGWLDWQKIPKNTRAKKIGLVHGLGNILVLVLFTWSLVLRWGTDSPTASGLSYVFSFSGAALLFVTGWLGGELVDRLTVGVDETAHLNAPNLLFEGGSMEKTPALKQKANEREREEGKVKTPFPKDKEPFTPVPGREMAEPSSHPADFRPADSEPRLEEGAERKSA